MENFYTFSTKADAVNYLSAVNSHSIFDNGGIVSVRNGRIDPTATKGVRWWDTPLETNSREWAVPIMPDSLLTYVGRTRANVEPTSTYNPTKRRLGGSDFRNAEVTI